MKNENSKIELGVSNVRYSLYQYIFPNFKFTCKPSRTESPQSDLIIDGNGRRKTKFFGL